MASELTIYLYRREYMSGKRPIRCKGILYGSYGIFTTFLREQVLYEYNLNKSRFIELSWSYIFNIFPLLFVSLWIRESRTRQPVCNRYFRSFPTYIYVALMEMRFSGQQNKRSNMIWTNDGLKVCGLATEQYTIQTSPNAFSRV